MIQAIAHVPPIRIEAPFLCIASMPPHLKSSAFLIMTVVGLAAGTLGAESPEIVALNAPQLWQMAEFRVENVPTAVNNFDPDQIRVDAAFTLPSGRSLTVPAFWYQAFASTMVNGAQVLTQAGVPHWRIRFTATEPGEHVLSVSIRLNGAAVSAPVVSRFSVSSVQPALPGGWVRIAADKRNFETSNGAPLRLVGANVCWAGDHGTADYDRWFRSMHEAGENFARLWMSPWWAGLEHRPGTLDHYDLAAAWQLDHIFRLAEADGIYLLFCFDHHGMYQVNNQSWGGANNYWKANPYNETLGGPCVQPNDFFSNPRAKAIYQKRLRYLVGRYGYSPYLLAWQFFNEIDNVFGPLKGDDVVAWHREMGQWLRVHDPYHHLVTTSLTGGSDRPEMWMVPELDFTSYHSYNEAATVRRLPSLARSFLERYDKPFMVGEFGISARDWDIAADPYLRGLRQGLWATALSGSVGSAMAWWWQDIDSDDVYPLYATMVKILRRAGWYAGIWAPIDFADNGSPPMALAGVIPGGEMFDAELALNSFKRSRPTDECAVPNRLAAERSSEFLSSYLQGAANPGLQRPMRLAAWFGDKGKLALHVNSVAADAELVVRVDGVEVLRAAIGDRDGQALVNMETNQDFSCDVTPGKHLFEITNEGKDWIYLDSVRFERVRPAEFAGGWNYTPEAVGLRRGGTAVLYVCSPAVVFPAGAHRYNPPRLAGQSVTLTDWPAGSFGAEWFDPATGEPAGNTGASTNDRTLTLPLPALGVDLVGIVTPLRMDSFTLSRTGLR